jgi:uncharacterized RDD family membrane protein YckC
MDDSYRLDTPERVALAFEIAGLGSRSLATMVDALIQVGLILAFAVAAGLSGGLVDRLADRLVGRDETMLETVVVALAVLVIFTIIWGYYIFFELVWNGQTPGKRVIGIRVLTTSGQPITLAHSLIRNLVRLVDFLPSSYMLGAIVMLLNGRSQRLGDLAAGTLVVKEARTPTPRTLPDLALEAQLSPQQASLFSAAEVALAREFLLRSGELEPERRHRLARDIADRFRARLAPAAADLSDELLLQKIAALRR